MKNVDVVIGLNYGDEGKGLVVDYLTNKRKENRSVAVARFNGGAQAAHTVELSDGTRHVFHHVSSGTFHYAPTILTRFFVVNPILFFMEAEELTMKVNQIPDVYVDPECPVTTPYEMLINQTLEQSRENDKHGSCGVGIGETIEREERGIHFQVKHLEDAEVFRERLEEVDKYFYQRVRELGIKPDLSQINALNDSFIADCQMFARFAKIYKDVDVFELYDDIIFEGAQGLSLDQYSSDFPHVTRSSTGLENISLLLSDFNSNINVYYLTRAYLTRHGAGPLDNEITDVIKITDKTNIPNEYQGTLRYAPLDYKRIKQNVKKDVQFLIDKELSFLLTAVVTCCDQAKDIVDEPVHEILSNVGRAVRTPNVLTSWGPIRECVVSSGEVTSLKDLGIDSGH